MSGFKGGLYAPPPPFDRKKEGIKRKEQGKGRKERKKEEKRTLEEN